MASSADMLLPSAAVAVSHWLGDELGMAACLTGATQSAHEGETQARRYTSRKKNRLIGKLLIFNGRGHTLLANESSSLLAFLRFL